MSSAAASSADALGDHALVETVQTAEVRDVLARAQALVDAARIRQHAEARAHGGRFARTSMPSTSTRPASGCISV